MPLPRRASAIRLLTIAAAFLSFVVHARASGRPVAESARVIDEAPRLAPRDLFADALWDDGQAEFTVFAGTITRYGKPRPISARLIVVKEDMDLSSRVKSEAGPVAGRTRPVIKQNYIQDFTTGTYDYHQMSSVFLDRESLAMRKLTMSSTEACGTTFVEILPKARAWRHVSHSYWDEEADRDREIVLGTRGLSVASDALPTWLRRLDLKRDQVFTVRLLPSQISNRVRETLFAKAWIKVAGRTDGHGYPVTVSYADGPDRWREDLYWFGSAWPHPLVRFEGGTDPTVLVRVKTMRIAYWKETAPGDERLLAP